ncbi:MAG: cytidylyltransferase domain-containing protein, partial [Gemmatimonadota bacterium]
MGVLCVLPARLSSRRVPRKPLQILAGKRLIEWTWETASEVRGVDRVVVATDSEEIVVAVRDFGGEAILTSERHRSGTDRVAEAARLLEAREGDVLVNFQADEPFADPGAVAVAVSRAARDDDGIATLAAPIRDLGE